MFHGDKVQSAAERPFQLSIWAKYDFEDAPDGGGALIAPNWALTAAHVVLTQTDVTLYPKVKIGGGSVFWKESMDSNFQSVEFETKNNVFVRKITQTWNELPWSGDGKSLLLTQLLVFGLIKFLDICNQDHFCAHRHCPYSISKWEAARYQQRQIRRNY